MYASVDTNVKTLAMTKNHDKKNGENGLFVISTSRIIHQPSQVIKQVMTVVF